MIFRAPVNSESGALCPPVVSPHSVHALSRTGWNAKGFALHSVIALARFPDRDSLSDCIP